MFTNYSMYMNVKLETHTLKMESAMAVKRRDSTQDMNGCIQKTK